MQGLLVSAYAHLPCATYRLLRITDPAAAWPWLLSATDAVTTAERKQEGFSFNVALTLPGLAELGLPRDALATFPPAFADGMASARRSRILGDTGDNELDVIVDLEDFERIVDGAADFLEPAGLDMYVGRYRMEEGVVVIAREDALLTIVLPDDWGVPKLPLYAESSREFFARALPLQASFEVDANGRVTGMLVHPPRGQRAIPARRL